jgi:ABC-type sugar transport system ATPase subunit
MARIDVEQVTKYYAGEEGGAGARAALDRVSMSVADGETVCLLGPSGSGKSTLLRVVAGLEVPDRGRVLYDGQDVTHQRPQEREVGMVFQDYALYPAMKGKGNLQYYFDTHHNKAQAEQRVRDTADVMGIDFETLLGQSTSTLSGGQQQRVAIARCIVRHPSLFLMDEPVANLDAKLRESTRIELKKLLRRFGISTVYVTHDQQEAVFMGDRIAVLRDGRLEQIGAFDDLYYAPVNAFVATFVGSPPMVLLPARVDGDKITVDGATWVLPPEAAAVAPGPVVLGVRPDGWQVGTPDGLEMSVRRLERLPAERAGYLRGSVAGTDVTVLVPVDAPDVAGVRLTPDLSQAYLFSASDGTAVHAPGVPDLF